ncbi:gas vesicle protein GvpO [Streptomyces botrytidirepellens]|uniref:Gas vesicle protein n=1 Tax=Streptomyces botrytidirepellens TaxID=2486417 RepID=A0A3M8STR6_9ACTN|nr:gas vesicle protein GvpO [Streptomyces botrytidirepellens]RNF84689.1 gas vesicle protein [Streptomyces botrytidirepellens]
MAERERRTSGAGTSRSRTREREREPGPEQAAGHACDRLAALITHPTEGVSAVRRTEDGWRVSVDVLEVARIPDTTSLLATYEVDIDERGELREYRRVRRYRRGAADDC